MSGGLARLGLSRCTFALAWSRDDDALTKSTAKAVARPIVSNGAAGRVAIVEQTGEIATGQLLIATQPGRGGYFDRSVILLVDHRTEGTVGLCLNVGPPVPAESLVHDLGPHLRPLSDVWEGGPVSSEAVIVLGELATPGAAPPGWARVLGEVGVVDVQFPIELLDSSFAQLRAFAGVSSWAPGQLESELLRGAWFRAWGQSEDVFGHPDQLWRRVLRRMGGATGRWSTWTEEPEQN